MVSWTKVSSEPSVFLFLDFVCCFASCVRRHSTPRLIQLSLWLSCFYVSFFLSEYWERKKGKRVFYLSSLHVEDKFAVYIAALEYKLLNKVYQNADLLDLRKKSITTCMSKRPQSNADFYICPLPIPTPSSVLTLAYTTHHFY